MNNHQNHPSGSARHKSGKSHDRFAKEAAAILKEHAGSPGDVKTLLHIATQQLLAEQQRSNDAEARLRELTAKMREVNDAKRLAVREAERAIALLRCASGLQLNMLSSTYVCLFFSQ